MRIRTGRIRVLRNYGASGLPRFNALLDRRDASN